MHGIVAAIAPVDRQERRHRDDTLAWIAGGAPLCRTARPASPPEHLVAYAVAVDRAHGEILLVDHRDAGRWLPTGGHVEPGEDPAAAAGRELGEELGITAPFLDGLAAPRLVTRTVTAGLSAGHTDVSLWYAFAVDRGRELAPDAGEFAGVRWWPWAAVVHGPGTRFDPHLPRFVAKVTG